MSERNVEVVRAQFAATNAQDFPRAMAYYDEGVELIVPPEAFLVSGRFAGRDAVGRWFADWFATFELGYAFEIEQARDLGDDVLLIAAHRGRGRASGAEVSGRTGYIYTVRDGLIVRVELFATGEHALAAAGLDDGGAGGH